jgi:hypothetical protein
MHSTFGCGALSKCESLSPGFATEISNQALLAGLDFSSPSVLWDTAIEEPCFALPLRFWHAWRERLARPDQRRLYRKSLQWSQSGLLFPGPKASILFALCVERTIKSFS